MKLDQEKLKGLLEAGDQSAIEAYIKNEALEKSDIYGALEKGDIVAAAAVNGAVLSELDSEKDKHQVKGLEKFKAEKLPSLLSAAKDEVRKELNQPETPEQKQIRELREEVEAMKVKEAGAATREGILKAAANDEELKLSSDFVAKYLDKFAPTAIPQKEDGTFDIEAAQTSALTALKAFATEVSTIVDTQVTEKLKGAARDDFGGGIGGQEQTTLSLAQQLAEETKKQQGQTTVIDQIFHKSK